MTRIVSYNILAGGYSLRDHGRRRTQELLKVIRATRPEIVGLVEAVHPQIAQKPLVVEEIAETLGMQIITTGEYRYGNDYQPAILTSLPIVHTHIHKHPDLLNKPLIEVCVKEANGEHLTVFLTHLSAAFDQRRGGDHLRQHEVREILSIMAPLHEQGISHLLMGDFNSLAPGDPFKASSLLRYVVSLDRKRRSFHLTDGHPHLNFVVPKPLRFLNPLLRIIPRSEVLCALFDAAASLYVPRGSIHLLRKAGYVDCYRHRHPKEWGFTCPAAIPAGRIDFIFASPALAERLETCDVMAEVEGLFGDDASDHLAVTAEFGTGVHPEMLSVELDSAAIR